MQVMFFLDPPRKSRNLSNLLQLTKTFRVSTAVLFTSNFSISASSHFFFFFYTWLNPPSFGIRITARIRCCVPRLLTIMRFYRDEFNSAAILLKNYQHGFLIHVNLITHFQSSDFQNRSSAILLYIRKYHSRRRFDTQVFDDKFKHEFRARN